MFHVLVVIVMEKMNCAMSDLALLIRTETICAAF